MAFLVGFREGCLVGFLVGCEVVGVVGALVSSEGPTNTGSRMPQSAQSVPYVQVATLEPIPPSSQIPLPAEEHRSVHQGISAFVVGRAVGFFVVGWTVG